MTIELLNDYFQNPFQKVTVGISYKIRETFYRERVDLECKNLPEVIGETARKHILGLGKTLERDKEGLSTYPETIHSEHAEGVIQRLRERFSEGDRSKTEKQDKLEEFDDFIRTVERRGRYEHHLKLNAFESEDEQKPEDSNFPWDPVKIDNGRGVIRDYELPLEASFARLLLTKPYSKIPYPGLRALVGTFYQSRLLRLDFIMMLLEGYGVRSNGVEVTDYELYESGVLVFKKEGDKLHFFNEERFQKLCTLPRNSEKLSKVINDRFIMKAVKNGYVPRESQGRLRQFLGHRIKQAIEEAGVFGDSNRHEKINLEEVQCLERDDRRLFSSITGLCDPHRMRRVLNDESVEKIEPEDESSMKIKVVAKYLAGSLGEESLSLSRESAPWLLKVIKMFDWSVTQRNCLRAQKEHFAENRSNLARRSVLELMPELTAFHAFSRTLFAQKLRDAVHMANPKNWTSERVALHAKIWVNSYISARTLSERMPSFRTLGGSSDVRGIVAGRGNSGVGKSTVLMHYLGTLSVDPIKWRLREGTNIKNSQIRAEGAMVFNDLFDVFKDSSNFFIMDLRLLDLNSMSRYVLKPAKKRRCPAMIQDLDAPLLTSLNRMFLRDPRGKDPCQNLDPIVSGFKLSRENRKKLISYIKDKKLVKEYYLYYLGERVAVKEKGKFTVLNEKLYQECLRIPTDSEIEKDLNRVIDDHYIKEACERGDLEPEELCYLERWKGETIGKAIEIHALQLV